MIFFFFYQKAYSSKLITKNLKHKNAAKRLPQIVRKFQSKKSY